MFVLLSVGTHISKTSYFTTFSVHVVCGNQWRWEGWQGHAPLGTVQGAAFRGAIKTERDLYFI